MYVLFISRYYYPEKSAPSVCVGETAKRLVAMGHQVTVLTTVPSYPTGIVPKEYRGRLLQEEVMDEVRIIRVWSYVAANKGFLKRILSQLSFGCLAPLIGGRAVGRPDLIIVGSPPLFNVIAARILAWGKRCPFIFWVADLWPASAVQFGVLRNSLLVRLSEWLEWSTYKKARLVWVVSEGVRDILIQRGLSPSHIFLLANGVDTVKFHPLPQSEARATLGWDNRFVVLYAGTHGLAHRLKTALEAADLLQNHHDIHFVLVGDGEEKVELVKQAQRSHLKNVTFLEPLPHHQMPQLLAASDICLVPTRKVPLLETTIPLKMFEVMACAKPMVLGAKGKARQIAEENADAAIGVEPENAREFASAILYLYEHPEEAKQMGLRGRAYVQTNFDYDLLTTKVDAQLHHLRKRP
jgi:glycosyltransferase involved in cell wall biosynthesis